MSNHSLSALLFYPKINEHDFYLKLNSIPHQPKKYSKTCWKVLTNTCFLQYNKIPLRRSTTNYISSQNFGVQLYAVHACGMRTVDTAAFETALNCRQQISVTDSFDFESQSRLHHCETKTARDKSILLYWSVHIDVPAFLLPKCRLQLNDRLNGI